MPDIPPDVQLKSALWFVLGQTIDVLSVTPSTTTHDINATPQFIGALTELVYAQIEAAARDVERFASHDGGRKVVSVKDVMVLGRKNESLQEVLEEEGRRIKLEGDKGR